MKPSRLNNILDRDAPHNRLLTPTIPHTHEKQDSRQLPAGRIGHKKIPQPRYFFVS